MIENSGDVELGQSGRNSLDRFFQGPNRDLSGVLDERDFVRILRLAQRLDEIELRPPLPARAVRQQALKAPMEQVRGLESNHLDTTHASSQIPQSCPQAHRLDAGRRTIADFAAHLGVIVAIRNEKES